MKNRYIVFLAGMIILGTAVIFLPQALHAAYGDVSTLLSRPYSGDGGSPTGGFLDFPEDIDAANGHFYIADTWNNAIREIVAGDISTLAGTGEYGDVDGPRASAQFAFPKGVSISSNGAVYVADTYNNKIKKIQSGTVTTIVSGLNKPEGVDAIGGTVYFLDTGNNALKKYASGTVTTITTALHAPRKLKVVGSYAYVADTGAHKLVKVYIPTGVVSVVAGSGNNSYAEGTGNGASFQTIWGVDVDGTTAWVTDGTGLTDRIRTVDLNTGTTSLFSDDAAMVAINYPAGIKVYSGQVYVANSGLSNIWKFDDGDETVNSKFAGKDRFGYTNGAFSASIAGRPWDMVMAPSENVIYLAENNKIRRVDLVNQTTALIAGNSIDYYKESTGSVARFATITGITVNSAGTKLYVTDHWNNRIRVIDIASGTTSLLSGGGLFECAASCNGYKEGSKTEARFDSPSGIVISPDDQYLYVTDTSNNRIRRVRISDGATAFIAGQATPGHADGVGSAAKFNRPYGITIDSTGEVLYVADSANHRIRKVRTDTGEVTTLAGSGQNGFRDGIGTAAVFSYPEYVKMGSDGNLYVSEVGSQNIRFIDPGSRSVRIIAGATTKGYKNGARLSAEFHNPKGLLYDGKRDKLYVADSYNDVVRQIVTTGDAPYAEPAPVVGGIEPESQYIVAGNSSDTKYLQVTGSNFAYGATVRLDDFTPLKTAVTSSTTITVQLPFGQMPPGYYDIIVTNLDGQSYTLRNAFIVLQADGSLPPADQPAAPSDESFYAYDPGLRGGYYVGSGDVFGDSAKEIVAGTESGLGPQVRIYNKDGNLLASFFAYDSATRCGVRVTLGDITGDSKDEIITVPGAGCPPHVRAFNGSGKPVIPGFFALDGKFKGGANIAAGNLDGSGKDELIIAASKGGGPHVTVHRADGRLFANFMAYDKNFRGGIVVSSIDFNGDGKAEILTGPEFGAPHLQMFRLIPGGVHRMNPGIFAFSRDFRGGISVAGGDVDGDGKGEIAVAQRTGGQAWVKVYNRDLTVRTTFLAYTGTFEGGTNVTMGDVDGDDKDEVVTIPGSSGGPQIKVFSVE